MFIGEQETSSVITVKSYYTSMLLGVMPIIGDILLLRWSNSNNQDVRENKRNMCKAFLYTKLTILYHTLAFLLMIIFSIVAQR